MQTIIKKAAKRDDGRCGPPGFDSLPDSQLLSDSQAAEFLTLAVGTLSVWRSTGRHALPYLKVGRAVRYRMGDLRAWLEKRERNNTGDGKTWNGR